MEQTSLGLSKPSNPKGFKAPKKKKEENIQIAVAKYLMMQYPDVIFNSDIASGMKLTMGQAVRAKAMRSEKGQPDMILLEPRGGYFGLCMELKNKFSDVFLANGKISDCKSKQHVRDQAAILERLRNKGYSAMFVCGFVESKFAIDFYMKLPTTERV